MREITLAFVCTVIVVMIFIFDFVILHGISEIKKQQEDILEQSSSVMVECPNGQIVEGDVGSLTIIKADN